MLKNLHGAVPRNGHIDSAFGDPTWTAPMAGQRHAYWYLGDEDNGPVVICMDAPPGPGGAFPVHAHGCDSVRIILDGSFMIGRKVYTAGEMRVQAAGAYYGPEVSQPTGSKQILVFADRREMWATFANDRDRANLVDAGRNQAVADFMAPVMGPDFYVLR